MRNRIQIVPSFRRTIRAVVGVAVAVCALVSDDAALGDETPITKSSEGPVLSTRILESGTALGPSRADGHSRHGEAFDDGPRQHAELLNGMGQVRFDASTPLPRALAFIRQGVGQLHSFAYFEAERSFRESAAIDPGCALAYWGMAMANANNEKRAKGFLAMAHERGRALTRRESLYIKALDAYYKDGATDKDRRQGLLHGWEDIVEEYPDDQDARAWLVAVALENAPDDGIGSRLALDEMLESVLRNQPMHPGGHHYRIHLWDEVKPERAIRSAELYARASPGIAHAWHMPCHTYTSLARYTEAAYHQEAAARVDHAAMARRRFMPFEIHNYAHNNQWLCLSLGHIGRVNDAIAVARNLVEQPRDPDKNAARDEDSAQRRGRLRWGEVLTRYELWDDLIEAAVSGDLDWSDIPAERLERAYRLGLAYAGLRDRSGLASQLAILRDLAADEARNRQQPGSVKADNAVNGPLYPTSPGPAAAVAELEGFTALLDGLFSLAFERFSLASAMKPDALARAYLVARDFRKAEITARKAAETCQNQVPALASLVEVLHAAGKDDEARDAYSRLLSLAEAADKDLPAFRRLKSLNNSRGAARSGRVQFEPPTRAHAAGKSRDPLASLGPLIWSPSAAVKFSVADTSGRLYTLADRGGKNVLILFFLGGACAHCMQQLQVFGQETEALKALNTEIVAISSANAESVRVLMANARGLPFPTTILPDPELKLFKAYSAFDDFERIPLHGTFLVDAHGDVRYQRVSAEPFVDVDFIKHEAARINRILKNSMSEGEPHQH